VRDRQRRGRSAVAHVLAAAGKSVLVLEAGSNAFPDSMPRPALSAPQQRRDQVRRPQLHPAGRLPRARTFRVTATQQAEASEDVNVLPKASAAASSTPT
jgi:choline dehydrogenase-like flavoprotein